MRHLMTKLVLGGGHLTLVTDDAARLPLLALRAPRKSRLTRVDGGLNRHALFLRDESSGGPVLSIATEAEVPGNLVLTAGDADAASALARLEVLLLTDAGFHGCGVSLVGATRDTIRAPFGERQALGSFIY